MSQRNQTGTQSGTAAACLQSSLRNFLQNLKRRKKGRDTAKFISFKTAGMQSQEKICGETGLLAPSPKFLQIIFVSGVGRS